MEANPLLMGGPVSETLRRPPVPPERRGAPFQQPMRAPITSSTEYPDMMPPHDDHYTNDKHGRLQEERSSRERKTMRNYAFIDRLAEERLTSFLGYVFHDDNKSWHSLRADDILAVPGMAALLAPYVVARLKGPALAGVSVDDAEIMMDLRREKTISTMGELVEVLAAQSKAFAPDAKSIRAMHHADRKLRELLQQLAYDLVCLGTAAMHEDRPALQLPAAQ